MLTFCSVIRDKSKTVQSLSFIYISCCFRLTMCSPPGWVGVAKGCVKWDRSTAPSGPHANQDREKCWTNLSFFSLLLLMVVENVWMLRICVGLACQLLGMGKACGGWGISRPLTSPPPQHHDLTTRGLLCFMPLIAKSCSSIVCVQLLRILYFFGDSDSLESSSTLLSHHVTLNK